MKLCCAILSEVLDLLGLRRMARLKDMPAVRLGLLIPAIGLFATVRLDLLLRSLGSDGDNWVFMWILGGA